MLKNYYSGGLAEFVDSPTPLTYSFLKNWFSGKGSVGAAMKLLGLPFEKNSYPILELIDGELLVNLEVEEDTLYKKTIFKYAHQRDVHKTPRLIIDIKKSINPTCIVNTSKIIFAQSQWISKPKNTIDLAQNLINTIPDKIEDMDIQNIDKLLEDRVWPVVIAIGLLSEFYTQLLTKNAGKNIDLVNSIVSANLAQHDWFFKSISDQEKVKQKQMPFSEFIKKYGLRADKDYELTSPRWHEIPDVIKKRIELHKNKTNIDKPQEISQKLQKLVDTSIQVQLFRSVAKQKTLIFMDQLRSAILQKTKDIYDITSFTRENIINDNFSQNVKQNKITPHTKAVSKQKEVESGKGISVSQGSINGLALQVNNNDVNIPKGTVGIFPNASPEFAVQFPKCVGLIFLKGGLTSHGSIVAREFGIPALIDNNAMNIKNGVNIKLDCTTGEWQIL